MDTKLDDLITTAQALKASADAILAEATIPQRAAQISVSAQQITKMADHWVRQAQAAKEPAPMPEYVEP